MTGGEGEAHGAVFDQRQLAGVDGVVGAAEARALHPAEHVVRAQMGDGHLLQAQVAGAVEAGGEHGGHIGSLRGYCGATSTTAPVLPSGRGWSALTTPCPCQRVDSSGTWPAAEGVAT